MSDADASPFSEGEMEAEAEADGDADGDGDVDIDGEAELFGDVPPFPDDVHPDVEKARVSTVSSATILSVFFMVLPPVYRNFIFTHYLIIPRSPTAQCSG